MSRRSNALKLTLFPFLSVLFGLIAVLMLFMIMTLSTRVVADAEQMRRLSAHTPLDEGLDPETFDQLQRRFEQLRQQLAQRRNERAELMRKQQELLDLLEAKKNELLVAVPVDPLGHTGVVLGAPAPINMVPAQGLTINEQPIFVEVSSAGYVVHPQRKTFGAIVIVDGTYEVSSDLASFLADVDRRKATHYLVFLVHPNGAAAFHGIFGHLVQHYAEVKVGWEPFSRDWILLAKERN
jgi:hypothetical protein